MKKIDVINYFKTPRKVAFALGLSDSAVSQWGDVIPEKNALRLDRLTHGALKFEAAMYNKKDKAT